MQRGCFDWVEGGTLPPPGLGPCEKDFDTQNIYYEAVTFFQHVTGDVHRCMHALLATRPSLLSKLCKVTLQGTIFAAAYSYKVYRLSEPGHHTSIPKRKTKHRRKTSMVKVIWHKATSLPHVDNRIRQVAPMCILSVTTQSASHRTVPMRALPPAESLWIYRPSNMSGCVLGRPLSPQNCPVTCTDLDPI